MIRVPFEEEIEKNDTQNTSSTAVQNLIYCKCVFEGLDLH